MRDDIRTVLLACVELDPDLSLDLLIDALVDLSQTFGERSLVKYTTDSSPVLSSYGI